ncbi:MAG: DUF3794 domain-containing protein [Clostridia bacterium]|nr:DUF3794 domain-containing protein [Clostridia bacterium]
MNISTNNMKLNLNKSKIVEKDERWIEQDIIVPDNMPDAIKIINISATPYINDIEVNNGRIKIVGKMNYSVIYRANDEDMNIRGLNVSYPYTTNLEKNNIKNKEDIIIKSRLKNIIYSLPNERKIAIKNEVSFDTKIIESVNVDIIKDFPSGQDIEYNKCKNCFNNIKQKKRSMITSSEDVMLGKESPAVYEMLKTKCKIKDTEYKESYNKIMLKGILEICILYLGEGKNICNERVDVPFSSMVELDNISDKSQFNIDYIIRDLNVRLNPDIDQKTLNVDYKIENNITLFEKEEVEYIDDFYSKTRDLKYDIKDVNITASESDIEKEINITESISDIIPENSKVIEYTLDTNGIIPMLEDNNIKVNGIAKLNLIIQNKDTNELESKTIDIMVDQNFPIDSAWQNSNVHIKVEDVKLNVIQNGTSIDIKITISVKINLENILSINSVENIEDAPINLKDISSINIYIVKPGDSIWKIAKKYKTSTENIIKINKLENPDVIDVGQKILIIR